MTKNSLGNKGDRIRLLAHEDVFSDLLPGAEGTIALVDDAGTRHVDWDNGSTLGLIPGHDRWEVLNPTTQN